jgi:hypothetical protein
MPRSPSTSLLGPFSCRAAERQSAGRPPAAHRDAIDREVPVVSETRRLESRPRLRHQPRWRGTREGLREESSGETSGDNREPGVGRTIRHYLGQYAVVLVMISLFLLFFPTEARHVLHDQQRGSGSCDSSSLGDPCHGSNCCPSSREFDLSVAAIVGLSAAVLAFLTSVHHWPVGLAIPVVFLFAVSIGGLNALLS